MGRVVRNTGLIEKNVFPCDISKYNVGLKIEVFELKYLNLNSGSTTYEMCDSGQFT